MRAALHKPVRRVFPIYIITWRLIIMTGYHHFHRPEPESNEQYQERLCRRREEQVAAEERRAKEDAERKIRLEKEREQGELLTFYCIIVRVCLFQSSATCRTARGGKAASKKQSKQERGSRSVAQEGRKRSPDATATWASSEVCYFCSCSPG